MTIVLAVAAGPLIGLSLGAPGGGGSRAGVATYTAVKALPALF